MLLLLLLLFPGKFDTSSNRVLALSSVNLTAQHISGNAPSSGSIHFRHPSSFPASAPVLFCCLQALPRSLALALIKLKM